MTTINDRITCPICFKTWDAIIQANEVLRAIEEIEENKIDVKSIKTAILSRIFVCDCGNDAGLISRKKWCL